MRRSLLVVVSMNFWPPKPGLTLITSTRSRKGSTSRTTSMPVAGFRATPARQPRSRICSTVRCR